MVQCFLCVPGAFSGCVCEVMVGREGIRGKGTSSVQAGAELTRTAVAPEVSTLQQGSVRAGEVKSQREGEEVLRKNGRLRLW